MKNFSAKRLLALMISLAMLQSPAFAAESGDLSYQPKTAPLSIFRTNKNEKKPHERGTGWTGGTA